MCESALHTAQHCGRTAAGLDRVYFSHSHISLPLQGSKVVTVLNAEDGLSACHPVNDPGGAVPCWPAQQCLHSSGIKRALGRGPGGAQPVRHARNHDVFFLSFSFSKILYMRLNSKIVFTSLKDTSRSPISYTSRNLWNNAFLDQIKWSQVFHNDS